MDTQVFDVDEVTGVVTLMHYDEETGRVTLETQTDVEPVLDLQQARQADKSDYQRWRGDLHHIGQIPMTILTRMRQQCFDLTWDGQRVFNKDRWKRLVTDWLNTNTKFRSLPWVV